MPPRHFAGHGGAIQVRALFEGLGAGYSVPVNAKLDRFVGGPRDETAPIGPGAVNLITGNFTVSPTDVSISGWGWTLRVQPHPATRVTLPPAPKAYLDQAGSRASRSNRRAAPNGAAFANSPPPPEEQEEGLEPYAILTDLKGNQYAFEKTGATWITPLEVAGSALTQENGVFVITDQVGNRTYFGNSNANGEYLPSKITQTAGSASSTQMVYELEPGKLGLKMIIAPTAEGITCNEATAKTTVGCRSLSLKYKDGKTSGKQ